MVNSYFFLLWSIRWVRGQPDTWPVRGKTDVKNEYGKWPTLRKGKEIGLGRKGNSGFIVEEYFRRVLMGLSEEKKESVNP